MAKKPVPEPDDKEQSERFKRTAEELGLGKDDAAFQRFVGAPVKVPHGNLSKDSRKK